MSEWTLLQPGVKPLPGGQFRLPDGRKVRGRKAVDAALGPRDPALPKTVAIVAMGVSAIDYLQDAARNGGRSHIADQVWAINSMGGTILHDALFACDSFEELLRQEREEKRKVATGMLKWVRQHPGPIYTAQPDPRVPGHVALPAEAIVNDIGWPYIRTSVSWAIAMAIYLRVERLALYGCDFTYPGKGHFEEGRANAEWLIGIAGERGIEIYMPEHTTILDSVMPDQQRLYGFHDPVVPQLTENGWAIRDLAEAKAEEAAFRVALKDATEAAETDERERFGRSA